MYKLACLLVLLYAAFTCADGRVQAKRGLVEETAGSTSKHPYLFLTVPRGRAGGAALRGFEIIKQHDDHDINDVEDDDDEEGQHNVGTLRKATAHHNDDDDEYDNDDEEHNDDDDDDDMENENVAASIAADAKVQSFANHNSNMHMILRNAKPTHMMVSRENAGAIMVPDGIIEIEGQSVIDEKTGKAALLVPRAALDAVPDGSVVALMERSLNDDETEEERANRVYVRRRRKGSRRNVRRRGGNKNRRNRRRGGNKNKRNRGNKRRGIKRIRPVRMRGGSKRRTGGGGRRPIVVQG